MIALLPWNGRTLNCSVGTQYTGAEVVAISNCRKTSGLQASLNVTVEGWCLEQF